MRIEIALLLIVAFLLRSEKCFASSIFVRESAREIPVVAEVDVVVVGGSSGAVAAAVESARILGAKKVFLAAPRPYLGEDICGTLRLWLEPDETPTSTLAKSLFSETIKKPLHVKKILDEALLQAGVEFYYSCYATEVLRDDNGNLAGVVISNRNGRQAVLAKVIIDATDRAWFARKADAKFSKYPDGSQTFKRIVVGGKAKAKNARKTGITVTSNDKDFELIEHTLDIPMKDGSFISFAEAEQVARDRTFDASQVDDSEHLFQIPPDCIEGDESRVGQWNGFEKKAFLPLGIDYLYILSGCADLSHEQAEKLLRPVTIIEVGGAIGREAAFEARARGTLKNVRVDGLSAKKSVKGTVKESLTGLRPTDEISRKVPSKSSFLPVLGTYDVVVIGGGTSGTPAAIAAAREGAKTLLVEYLYGLGGVGTQGLIGKYYHGYRGGFTAQVDKGIGSLHASVSVVGKIEWWRREARKSGAEIWFGAMACGAFVDKGVVKGVVVATPEGRGVVLGKVVVDSTGNADVAFSAGAKCRDTDSSEVAVQGAGLPPRELGAFYTNTDYTFSDETDLKDVQHLFVYAKEKFPKAYDLGQLVDTRERRQIYGDFFMTPIDMLNGRTYPDSVVQSKSNFDSHGFTIDPVFLLAPPDRESITIYTPYRCLIPKGLEGILVTGLGVSVHRDAMPVVRMQPDLQNQGYAAGLAAAQAAKAGLAVRKIDIRKLQKKLIAIENIPESVLLDPDSFPLPIERIESAADEYAESGAVHSLAALFSDPKRSKPFLRKIYTAATDDAAKIRTAQLLAILGDKAGVEMLAGKIDSCTKFDTGWNYTGMGQYGMSMSPLDGLIVALGRTEDSRGLASILAKARLLDASKEFSHHRAVALGLEMFHDSSAAKALAEVLAKPGMTGYAVRSIDDARLQYKPDPTENESRITSLRELCLARALYRCGDYKKTGETILKQYAQDLRGHYARHAKEVLREGKG